MRKYTQKELKNLIAIGAAEDITTAPYKPEFNHFEKIGLSTGIYGMNGGLLQDPSTGKLYAITARNTNLFRLF